MTTAYTSLLGLALPVTGELSGTWGDTVNNYLTTYVDTAVAGQLAISLTADVTLIKATGTSLGSTSSQYAILNVTPNASTWTITVPAASQIYHINNLSSTYTFSFKASGGTAITVAAAEKCVVAYNGSNFVRVSSTSVFGSPSTAMTLDTSGNVGLGTTPSAWGSGLKFIQIGNGAGANGAFGVQGNNLTQILTNVYSDGTNYKYLASSIEATAYNQTVGKHQWFTAPSGTAGNNATFTQTMTLDSSGTLLVGYTTSQVASTLLQVNSSVVATGYVVRNGTGGSYGPNSFNLNFSTPNVQIWIDTTNLGNITIISDYRLKENVAAVSGNAISRVMQLNPIQFNRKEIGIFKGSNAIEEGFFAHELQDIIPSAVFGEKDALTVDGGVQPQSLNWSPIVATLVKAIQEQQAMIELLTDRITQLEAK